MHLTTYLQGGLGRIIQDLAIDQRISGNKVTVVTTKTPIADYCNYDEYLTAMAEKDVELHLIDSTFKRELYLNLNVVEKVRDIIKKNNIDIIHTHAAIPALVGVIARQVQKRHIPVIHSMQGWGTNKSFEQEEMDRIIMNGLDCIVASSVSSIELMKDKGIDSDKMVLIYNGIADRSTDMDESSDEAVTELMKLKSEGIKVIGCVGTVCKRKNQELLLDAFSKIAGKYNAVCVFIGEGDMVPSLKEKAELYNIADKVRFYGYKEDSSRFLKYFDFVVLPSLSEGQPLTVLECFRERVLFLGSDIPSIAELVRDGDTGFLFASEKGNDLTNGLIRAISVTDAEKHMITENAHKFFGDGFTKQIMFDKYMSLYKKYLNEG